MLDTGKLPHLQPSPKTTKEETPPPSLLQQIISAFSGRKGLLCLTGSFILIYMTLCVQGERLLRQGLYNVFKDLGEDGFGISYSAPSSCLAYKSSLDLDDLVITAPEKMGGWVLKAGRISISSTPFTPRNISLKINGTHSLTTKTIGDIRLIIGQGDIRIRLPYKNSPFSLNLSLKQVQTGAPKSMDGFFVSDLDLTAEQTLKNPEEKTSSPIRFSFKADAIHLPAYMTAHLPPMVESVELSGDLSGLPFNAVSFLNGWLNNSGTAEIRHGEIYWPPFRASLTGTFGLNNSFELIGAGTAVTEGFFPLLDMLQKGDYLRTKRVSVAKVVLGEQAEMKEDGKQSLTSAFSIQYGKIYIGQVLLYDRNE